MHHRGAVDAEHARDREAPHVGVDDGDRVAPLGQGDGEVGGDRRLADAALARRDEQARGCATRGSANGIARPSAWPWAGWRAGRRGRVAVELLADARRARSSVITVKSRPTAVDAGERADGAGRPGSVISLRSGQPATVRATSDADAAAVDRDVADHAEVDDDAVQLGVLDGSEGLDDLRRTVTGMQGRRPASQGISTTADR